MQRRRFVGFALGAGAGSLFISRVAQAQQGTAPRNAPPAAKAPLPAMTVYKSASCGCCHNWVEHARSSGFTVKTIDTEDLAAVKRDLGVPSRLQSCHTVVVGNYLVEGHVPAADVKRLLAEKPAVRGIAVPGMPVGAPGMEQGAPADHQRYEVIAFTAAGVTSVFARH